MNVFEREEILKATLEKIKTNDITYKQYLHRAICRLGPCGDPKDDSNELCCAPFIWCIHASNQLHVLPKHPNCDCFYKDVKIKPLGSISTRSPSPDLWLKMFGKLPDYYITKQEAEKLGWTKGKDLSKIAPNKMIGGDIYKNRKHILPEKDGRQWFECDINYESGKRNSLRLFYSNDGLMFYSPDHLDGNVTVYQIN